MQEPAYPIFFPTYTAIEIGYARDWWWYDPFVNTEDMGPFETRSDAVADWAWEHLSAELISEAKAIDKLLQSPLLMLPPIEKAGEICEIIQGQQRLQDQAFVVCKELEQMSIEVKR